MSQLIPNLNDLKNQYLDPLSYLNTIVANPKEFNPKTASKILENSEQVIPLQLFTQIYKISEECRATILEELKVERPDLRINPLYIFGLIASKLGIRDYDISDEDIRKSIFEDIKFRLKYHNIMYYTYSTRIDHYIDDYLLVEKMYALNAISNESSDPEYKKYELYYILTTAFKNLKTEDNDVYDTDEPSSYIDKIIPYIRKLVDPIDIESLKK